MCNHLFVVTGGPGGGKTTLIDALAGLGLRSMPEAGRAIIRDQVRIGGEALPWKNRAAFAELMLGWETRSHHEASGLPGPVLMDRGLPDVIGYLTLSGLPVPAHAREAARVFRYNPLVFIAPFWDEIFTRDKERRQDAAEAQATCAVMADVYSRLGYRLVRLPLASVEERAAFVMDRIGV
ncbi:AAA family ATPase [Amaricoccus sp. W119]|uniref:AAA family ATPase n=1 Tax=Amaricoccus sp. W119 TaxID=3391833 RepID=UPI0039A73D7A